MSHLLASVASPAYDKDVALVQDKQREVQLKRLGEVVLSNGEWAANDEKVRSYVGWKYASKSGL